MKDFLDDVQEHQTDSLELMVESFEYLRKNDPKPM